MVPKSNKSFKSGFSPSIRGVGDEFYTFWLDFSYVLKVGKSIDAWRDAFKKTMHTAGFYFTGQVDLVSTLNAQIKASKNLRKIFLKAFGLPSSFISVSGFT